MIPEGAWFRRAEGLWITVAPCRGLDEVSVVARRQDGDVATMLSRTQVRLLSQLSQWRTAAELGVSHVDLVALCDARLAFWSRVRPEYVLTGAPLDDLGDKVALRDNVRVAPLLADRGQLVVCPDMPRLGALDGVLLAGVRLEVVEWETSVATISIACCRRHAAALRDLIPRLDGRSHVDDLGERILIEALDDLGLLERRVVPTWDGQARVTWLGHAGVLYEASGVRVVIDPPSFARSNPTRYGVKPFDLRDLGDLSCVLISHGDADHLDLNALLRVPRDIPVVIPRPREPRPYHVDMRAMLRLLAFERVIEVSTWDRVPLGDVTVIAAPFVGEDWGLELPTSTYAIAGPALTIYANADSLTDPDTCDRLARELAIDVAFVGVTGAAESHAMPPGFGYGHFYTQWIPPERHAEWVELCNGPRAAADCARRIRARYAFGYAAGGAPFCSVAYCDRGTHDEMAAALGDGPTRPIELEVGVPRVIEP